MTTPHGSVPGVPGVSTPRSHRARRAASALTPPDRADGHGHFYPAAPRGGRLEGEGGRHARCRFNVLAGARAAHRGLRWDDACAGFLAVDAPEGLAVDDLEMLAECAQLSGRHEAAVSALERAFALRVRGGGPRCRLHGRVLALAGVPAGWRDGPRERLAGSAPGGCGRIRHRARLAARGDRVRVLRDRQVRRRTRPARTGDGHRVANGPTLTWTRSPRCSSDGRGSTPVRPGRVSSVSTRRCCG